MNRVGDRHDRQGAAVMAIVAVAALVGVILIPAQEEPAPPAGEYEYVCKAISEASVVNADPHGDPYVGTPMLCTIPMYPPGTDDSVDDPGSATR